MKNSIQSRRRFLLLLVTIFSLTMLVVAGGEPIARVNGSGERDGVTVTVAAVRHSLAIDDVSGSASFFDRNTNSKLSIDVTGLTIVSTDRLASVSGEVTKSTGAFGSSFPVGSKVSFQVDDEGQGEGSIPDGFTIPYGGPAYEEPKPREDGGLLPASERGNIQVEGSESGK
jgi:hypothetical protein